MRRESSSSGLVDEYKASTACQISMGKARPQLRQPCQHFQLDAKASIITEQVVAEARAPDSLVLAGVSAVKPECFPLKTILLRAAASGPEKLACRSVIAWG